MPGKPLSVKVGDTLLEIVEGDITRQEVDAIVNAANRTLLGGGGVDGAIHRAGGPAVLEECRLLGGCETGDAKATTAGRMKAERVIHTVGPVWRGGDKGEARLLESCHRRCLEIARREGLRSVAFPAVSTGVYGYPMKEAARVALSTVLDEIGKHPGTLDLVRFVLFGEEAFRTWKETLEEIEGKKKTP